MRDKLVLTAVALLVAAVLAGYGWVLATDNSFSRVDFGMSPLAATGLPSYLKGRVDPKSAVGRWASGETFVGLRNFMRDEFLGLDRLIIGYSSVAAETNEHLSVAVDEPPALVPVGVESAGVFLFSEEGSLVRAGLGDRSLPDKVPQFVAATDRMVEAHPDVHFVFYGVTPWGMTERAIELGYEDASGEAWRRFSKEAGDVAGLGVLDVKDWSEYFFATDHHWKPYGAFQGYLDITRLLQQQDPDLKIKPFTFSEKVVDSVDFRGAHARKAAYKGLSEPFRVITTRDPSVHAYLDGKLRDDLIAPDDYFPDPPNKLFQSHYSLYNGGDHHLIEYRTGAKDRGNLLLFADSFSNSMEDLLAASFGNTYSVDLRYYKSATGEAFDLDAFIAEHDITHVVFLSRPGTVMRMPLALEKGEVP